MIQKPTDFENDFIEKYGKGTVVQVTVTDIIKPSQLITNFFEGFIGRLSLLDISWNLPEGEAEFSSLKTGDKIECLVLDIDFINNQVKLSKKHLMPPLSNTTKWKRIERSAEFNAKIVERYASVSLLSTQEGFFGIINNQFLDNTISELRVKVKTKLEENDLLSFVPASYDLGVIDVVRKVDQANINFIEDDLKSFDSFKSSLLGRTATDEQIDIVKRGFELDKNIFSKEFKTTFTLFVQFELNSSSYETTLKYNAIPFFLDGQYHSEESEKKMLELLSNQIYWVRLNLSGREGKVEFSLYNEEINLFGEVKQPKGGTETKFIVRNFSFGHIFKVTTESKKRNEKQGSFLLNNSLKIISPYDNIPLDNSQENLLEYATVKTQCVDIVSELKKEAGAILVQQGRTLGIIDKFLEYQLSLIEKQKHKNTFVSSFSRAAGEIDGTAIRVPLGVGKNLEIEDEAIVNLRIKDGEKLAKVCEGMLTIQSDSCVIYFRRKEQLDSLKNGFYIDKRISKRQFAVQRGIIQDFLAKKIKIDHIESLLVQHESVKTPILKNISFKNEHLARTEKEQPNNNQIKAVKKAVGNQNIFLIQGPPGTGKTTVIAEIIQQLVEQGQKILVSGQNHVAVDNVLEKLSSLPNLSLLRVGNEDRFDKNLLKFSMDNLLEEYKIDFRSFLGNQVSIAKKWSDLRSENLEKRILDFEISEYISRLSAQYGALADVYKHKHFSLLELLDKFDSQEINDIITIMEEWISNNISGYEFLLKPLIYHSIDVVFATCIGIRTNNIFKDAGFKFDTVIVDEAGKANIAESLVAMELGKNVILVGDQKQLPPYMDSSLIDKSDPDSFPNSPYGLGYSENDIVSALKTSFFEFIVDRINTNQYPKESIEMLNYQHRMHPNIGQFVSDCFYGGKLRMGSLTYQNSLDLPSPFNKEIVYFDTSNSPKAFEQNDGFSVKNIFESHIISEIILPELFEYEVAVENIAIIAPYKSQVNSIKKAIDRSSTCKFKNVDVSTLDSFQGKEYDIIVFSFTRSADHNKALIKDGKKKYQKVGFLDDARRLNVAFSRAKKKLILVGNSKTLTDPRSHYDRVFNYTSLFKRLVELSKTEHIGNFVNITDYNNKSTFKKFIEKYKLGDFVKGRIMYLFRAKDRPIGLFIKIDDVQCLVPYSLVPTNIRNNTKMISDKVEITVKIINIDIEGSKITASIPTRFEIEQHKKELLWERNISEISVGQFVSGEVINETDFGFFVRLDNGIEGLLHRKDIFYGKKIRVNDSVRVNIKQINNTKRQISFKVL